MLHPRPHDWRKPRPPLPKRRRGPKIVAYVIDFLHDTITRLKRKP